jgi:capsule polysaccharide export protein KpsE/RkpR
MGILKSRTMEDRLISQFQLQRVYGVSGMDKARKKLEERTEISSDRLSGIITLTVRDHDAKRAAAMGQAYIDGLNSMVASLSTSSARRERIFLEGRLKDVNQNLETAEKSFSQFASKNTAVDIPEEGKAVVSAAATLEGQLIAAESELEGLKQIYTDNNVRVRSVDARVSELRRQLRKMGGQGEGSDPGDETNQSLFPSIRKLPLLGVTYADLYRQAKVQEAVFEALTQEYELAKVEEAKEIPTVKVLDEPNIPERKAFPPRLLIICCAGFLSLALGIVWVLGNERWMHMDPQDPAKLLAGEIFATVRARLHLSSRNGASPSAHVTAGHEGRSADGA